MGASLQRAKRENNIDDWIEVGVFLFLAVAGYTALEASAHRSFNQSRPPLVGRLTLCLLLPLDKQADRVADFDEMLNTVWIPQFGPRIGRLIYIWHAFRSAGAIIRIGITAAIVDRIVRTLWH